MEIENKCVADMVGIDGTWKCNTFDHLISNNQLLQIVTVKPPSLLDGEDQPLWGFSRNGKFTTKSAYLHLCNHDVSTDSQLIWRLKGPHGVKVFLWLIMHGKLKTK